MIQSSAKVAGKMKAQAIVLGRGNVEKCKSNIIFGVIAVSRDPGFSLRVAITVLGLENHKTNHDRDQANGSYHQGKDNHWWRVALLL